MEKDAFLNIRCSLDATVIPTIVEVGANLATIYAAYKLSEKEE